MKMFLVFCLALTAVVAKSAALKKGKKVCLAPLDLGILVDMRFIEAVQSSQRKYAAVVKFLKNFDISESGAHVSLGTIPQKAEVVLPLNASVDIKKSVKRALQFEGDLETALQMVIDGKMMSDDKMRAGAKKVLVVLTDGICSRCDLHTMGRQIEARGITIFTLSSFFDDVDLIEAIDIAGSIERVHTDESILARHITNMRRQPC